MYINWVFFIHFFITVAIGHWTGKNLNPTFEAWAKKVECIENRSPASELTHQCQELLRGPVREHRLNKNKKFL